MNKRFIGVLFFAFVVAALGGLVTYRQLISHAPAPAGRPNAHIVVASKNLDAGALIGPDDVTMADWAGPIPDGATSTPADYVGRGVITEIFSKEPVTESRLAPKGSGGGMASLIPAGMRAFAVRVNEVAGVAGFVIAGQHVDVVINGSPPDAEANMGSQARTLLQNVEVLSAGQDFKKDAEGKPILSQVVNLLVSPQDAEKLILAANQTSVQLVLRNPLDREAVATPGIALATLFHPGMKASPAAPPPAPKPPPEALRPVVREVAQAAPAPFIMEILEGGQKTEKKFAAVGGGQ